MLNHFASSNRLEQHRLHWCTVTFHMCVRVCVCVCSKLLTFLSCVRVCVNYTSSNDWFLRRISPTPFILCVCVFEVFLLTLWCFRYCFCYGVTVTCLMSHISAEVCQLSYRLWSLTRRHVERSVPTLIYSRSDSSPTTGIFLYVAEATHNTQKTDIHAPGRIQTHNFIWRGAVVCPATGTGEVSHLPIENENQYFSP